MIVTPRTLSLLSVVLMGALVAVGVVVGGPAMGGGVAASAGLMIVNLLGWVVLGRRIVRATAAGTSATLPALLHAAKFGLVVGALWFLCRVYPASAVLLGSSVVVGAVLLLAALGLGRGLQLGEC